MKKKLLSLIMAVAMIASLAVPALATTPQTVTTPTDGVLTAQTRVDGVVRTPVLKVTLPGTTAANKIILNPYELKLFTSATSGGGIGTASGGGKVASGDDLLASATGKVSPQVITVPLELKSESDVPLMVGVKATAEVEGEVKLSAQTVDQSLVGTDKNVFLYLDMTRAADGAQVSGSAWDAATAPKWHDDPTKVNTTAYPQVIPTTSGATAPKLFVIPEGDGTAAGAKYAYFKIMGSVAPDTKKDWAHTDTVKVTLAFTFAPTKLYPIQAHKGDSATGAGSDYTVGYGDTAVTMDIADKTNVSVAALAASGTPVVVKAKDKYVFTSFKVVKPDDTANNIKEENETRAADPVKISNDTYYFIMPADKNGVVIRAAVEQAS